MEILSFEFFTALAAIIVIDLVLAGDNAIVIALAARKLPDHLKRRAVIWGTAGAVVMRTIMTMVVVWLLKVPGLMLVGGVLLVWIAWRLLLPEEGSGGHENGHGAAANFWGAIRTIVIADTVMGLDNVLAVAGAAHGSYLLVVLGLLISVPIMVWGSTLLLRWVERFPVIVYIGAGVLAMTAAKMVTSEPLLEEAFEEADVLIPLTYLVMVGGVLWSGFARTHRSIESRITARLRELAERVPAVAVADSTRGDVIVKRLLVPVDATKNSEFAIRHVANRFLENSAMEVHLLNVQRPLSKHVAQFVARGNREDFHREESERALGPARAILDSHHVPYSIHVKLGERAETIVSEADRLEVHEIVMASARKNSLTRMIEDSVTTKVLEKTSVPVEIIAGEHVSKLERIGIPAGLAMALALLLSAAAG